MRITTNADLGAFGEKRALKYLKKNKYKILEKNYKTKLAECDIIAKKDNIIAFIEVKTRRHNPLVKGAYAVNKTKQNHIIKAAQNYIVKHKLDCDYRFDVIELEVDIESKKCVLINHIENAFAQNGSYSTF